MRCCNRGCERRTFSDLIPRIARPFARRTRRVSELVHLVGHAAGGRPPERLMKRLGLPQSDDTILRQLKRRQAERGQAATVRVASIDDRSWRKGCSYGTIVVDLERREVVDVALSLLWYRVIPKCVPWCAEPNPSAPGRSRCSAIDRSRPCRPAPDRGSSEGGPCTRRDNMGHHNNREAILCGAVIF
jgi:hypothetical protein